MAPPLGIYVEGVPQDLEILAKHDAATANPAQRNRHVSSPNVSAVTFQDTPAMETQAFLYEHVSKGSPTPSTHTIDPVEERTWKQLRRILLESLGRWILSAALYAGYIIATTTWTKKGPVDERSKQIYNTITTGLSIALALNTASTFKEMALNLRWPVLHAQKRNLHELDLILHGDSMTSLAKLCLKTRGAWIIIVCILWLLLNIVAQAGIAAIALTYGFEVDEELVLHLDNGQVTTANMSYFFPLGGLPLPDQSDDWDSEMSQMFAANAYGQLFTSSNDSKDLPGDDTIVKDGKPLLWFDSDQKTFVYKFTDIGDSNVNAYSTRTINTTYACESHKVDWSGFNEMLHSNIDDSITPEGLNDSIYITDQLQSNNTFYFVSFLFDSNGYNGSNDASTLNICSNGDPRCTIVQAFEYGADNSTDYWYYNCSITLGTTQGDVYNVSYINDETASYATNAIAQTGPFPWLNDTTFITTKTQMYPMSSYWGAEAKGDADIIGQKMAQFALGSIAGAATNNPTFTYTGRVPTPCFRLKLNHSNFYFLIIGLELGIQFLLCVVVAVMANRVMVQNGRQVEMSMLLRPVADRLQSVSGGKNNRALRRAKEEVCVKYERGGDGRWDLKMV